jgi:hypothetical protein
MFERFTDRARRVVVLAQEEAMRLDHNYIGTEHLLLGLLREEQGVAAVALAAVGVELEAVRARLEEAVGRGTEPQSGHIPFTPRAKKVLELSLREALQLGHNYIGTEHILLGLIREGNGLAAQFIVGIGVPPSRLRAQVIGLLRDMPAPARAAERVAGGGVFSSGERGLVSNFRAQLKSVESRLKAVEQRVGFGPDVREVDDEIVRLLGQENAAADAQEYELAASLRDRERELIAERDSRQRDWSAAHPDLSSLAETVRRLGDEVRSLNERLNQAGVAPAVGQPESREQTAPEPVGEDEEAGGHETSGQEASQDETGQDETGEPGGAA